jgi:hypothetical protein
LSQYLPLYALFSFFALNNPGQPNWTVPALVTGIIFTVVFWRELVARKPEWRWAVGVSFAITAIITVGLHDTDILHLPPKMDPMRRTEGWPDLAAHIQKARVTYNANVLLGTDYQIASLMAFYLPDQPDVYLPPAPYGSTQFTLWPDYKVTPDTRALYVTWDPEEAPETLQKQFTKIQLVEDFQIQYHRQPTRRACIYLCSQ